LSPRWQKVLRDLVNNKSRTLLVVLAIAVGVFAFGGVLMTREIAINSMVSQYRDINSSSISISIPAFDEDLVRWASRQENVTGAQGRSVSRVKLLTGQKTLNLDLIAFREIEELRINRVVTEQGSFPPGRREIVIERSSLPLTGAAIGDLITIELPDGRLKELRLVGTVKDLKAIPGAIWPQLSAYVDQETLGLLGLETRFNRLDLTAGASYRTIPELESLADSLKVSLLDMGVRVASVAVNLPDEHWAYRIMESVAIIMSGIGFFALFLSGFLVINTISALLAQQKRQVGMMKLVGGTGRQILTIYLVMIIFYGLLALFVAVPAGVGLAWFFTNQLTNFLNIDVVNFRLPPQILIAEALVAVGVPVLASLVPVLGGVHITTREALSDFGSATGKKPGRFISAVTNVRGLSRPFLLSMRNTFRARGRLILTLTTLTLAGVLFISVLTTRFALMNELDRELRMWGYQVEFYLDGSYPEREIKSLALQEEHVTQVEGRSAASVQRVRPDGTKESTFTVFGIPPDSDFVNPIVVGGRWLQPGDRNQIVLTSDILRNSPDLHVGDEIKLDSGGEITRWTVAGSISMISPRLAYAPLKYLKPSIGERGEVSQLFIRTEPRDPGTQAEVAKALEKRFKDRGIRVSQWLTNDTIVTANASQFDFLITYLLIMALLAALIGGLGLASTLSLNVLERTREIGVMRSIGATNSTVSGIVVGEGLVVGVISGLLSIPISLPASYAFGALLGDILFHRPMPFLFSWQACAVWMGIAAVIAIISSLMPARRAAAMSVRETLSYE
jgi:putative ABC transport system permease protein